MDCAVVELNEGSFHSEVAGVGRIRRPALATAGLHVCKYGHTTKLTHGVVDTVDLTVKIGDRLWKNQIGIKVDAAKSNQFGHRGDSGAVVLNNTQEPVGLYFARSADGTYGAANPIHDVLDALHVDIYEEQLSGLDRDIDDSIRELTSPFAWGLGGASTPLIANLIAACRDCDDC